MLCFWTVMIVLEKGAIEALMTKAEQSGADMVEGGFRQFDDAGNTIYTQIYEPREHLPSLNGFHGQVIRSEMFKTFSSLKTIGMKLFSSY